MAPRTTHTIIQILRGQFTGSISSAAALYAAFQVADRPEVHDKTIVTSIPSLAERYSSTPLFEATSS